MYRRYRLGALSIGRLVSIDTIQGCRVGYRREREGHTNKRQEKSLDIYRMLGPKGYPVL